MRPIVTDRVAWSVCLFVGMVFHSRDQCKKGRTDRDAVIETLFGLLACDSPKNHALDMGPDPPMRKG